MKLKTVLEGIILEAEDKAKASKLIQKKLSMEIEDLKNEI